MKKFMNRTGLFSAVLLVVPSITLQAATVAGLPFTEDFTTQDHIDTTSSSKSNVSWSEAGNMVNLAWQADKPAEGSDDFLAAVDIGVVTDDTSSVVMGDVNNDGFLDLVVGNSGQRNKLYLNDGVITDADAFTTAGFAGAGTDIGVIIMPGAAYSFIDTPFTSTNEDGRAT